MKYRLAFFFA